MMKVGRLYEICKMDNEMGEKYRAMWDKKTEEDKTKGILKSGPPPTVQEKGQKKGCGCGSRQPAVSAPKPPAKPLLTQEPPASEQAEDEKKK
jgi:hypothetical protein